MRIVTDKLKNRGKGSLGKVHSVTERAFKACLGEGERGSACTGWYNMKRVDRKAQLYKHFLLPMFIRE